MSERAPEGPYVYQPHPVSRKDGRLWMVSGLPDGMTREQAQAIVDILKGAAPRVEGWLCDQASIADVINQELREQDSTYQIEPTVEAIKDGIRKLVDATRCKESRVERGDVAVPPCETGA